MTISYWIQMAEPDEVVGRGGTLESFYFQRVISNFPTYYPTLFHCQEKTALFC